MKKDKGSKQGTRVIMVRVDADTYRTLRVLAASKGKDNAEVITEAINLLVARQGGAS